MVNLGNFNRNDIVSRSCVASIHHIRGLFYRVKLLDGTQFNSIHAINCGSTPSGA